MWWRILVEVVLGLIVLSWGHGFWSLVKSRSWVVHILHNEAKLTEIIHAVGAENLARESRELKPVWGSWLQNIDVNSKIHFKAQNKGQWTFLVGVIISMAISFFVLGWIYACINVAFFLITAIFPMSENVKNQDIGIIYGTLLNLYAWYRDDQKKTIQECPKSLAKALSVVSAGSTDA